MTALNRKTASGITRDGHDLSPQPLGVIEFRNKRELATPIVDNLDVLGSGRAGRRWNQLSPESLGIGHEGLRTRWKREMSHAVVDPRRANLNFVEVVDHIFGRERAEVVRREMGRDRGPGR